MPRIAALLLTVVITGSLAPDLSRAALQVEMAGDSTLTVAAVSGRLTGFVQIIGEDGVHRYLGAQRVRRITDANGTDRTRDVIDRKMTIGTPPPGSEAPFKAEKFSVGKAALLAGFLALAAVGLVAGLSLRF